MRNSMTANRRKERDADDDGSGGGEAEAGAGEQPRRFDPPFVCCVEVFHSQPNARNRCRPMRPFVGHGPPLAILGV